MKHNRALNTLVMVLFVINLFAPQPLAVLGQGSSATLTTDKTDYAPGEIAQISGSGFSVGDYVLAVSDPDGTADWGTVNVGEDGGFSSVSPALDSVGTYEVRAYASGWGGDWSETAVASAGFSVTEPVPPAEPPTEEPTSEPTLEPSDTPTVETTIEPTAPPADEPTATSAIEPTNEPTAPPTDDPTATSTIEPTVEPTAPPTDEPTATSTTEPAATPTDLPQPSILSDKTDYNPGELVTLAGGDWQGDSEVRIIVNDDIGQTWRRDVTVPVGSDGSISDSFNLPTFFVATYTVTARGLQTDRVATTTFTDAPLPNSVSMVTWRTQPSGAWINGTLQANNSDFSEGETVPFRLEAGTLALSGNPYTANICRDYQLGNGVFGFTTLQPFNTSRNATAGGTISSTSGPFSGVNLTIVSVNETGSSSSGAVNCGSTQRLTIVTFNVIDPAVQTYLLWGGRLASPSDPGVGEGKSASFWSGGSLQMRLASPDKTSGIQPSAVIRLAKITVQKVVDSGSATPDQWCFNISPNPNGETLPKCPAAGTDTITFLGLPTDNYQVTETTVSGYAFASGTGTSCTFSGSTATASVTASQNTNSVVNATCVFHNAQQKSTITIIKDTVPDDPQDFSYTTTGSGLTSFSLDDDADATLANTKTFSSLNSGTYTVIETLPVTGFDLTSLVCIDPDGGTTTDLAAGKATIDLDPNETVTCTYTNTQQAATLTLVKTVTNNNGGTAVANDFQAYIDGNAVPWGVAQTVSPGSHSASESVLSGYTASAWGGDCAANGSVSLSAGQNKTCTITNDDQAATLVVIKHVINDNGGTAVAADFTLDSGGANDTPDNFAGVEAPGTTVTLDAGAFNVTESGPSGYTASFSADCSGTIANGQTKTCTVTNDDVSAHLTLVKVVVNDNGGSAAATDWTLNASGPTPQSGAGGADGDVSAGTYTLSETGPTGYTASAWVCAGGTQNGSNITLANGESATCTITNDDNAPSLTLVKQVVNDNGGTAVAADFTLSAGGPTPIFGAGGATSDATFDAGTYDLSETNVPGYAASDWACVGGTQNDSDTVTIGLGEIVTCTITNDDNAPSLTLVKVVVNDNGGTALATDFTLSATGPTSISGAGGATSDATFDAGTYDLSETGPAGYSASDWVCEGGTQDDTDTITLGLGESATCTIMNDDQASSLTLVKVVVNDDGGGAVPSDWTLTATGPTGFAGTGPSVSSGASFDAGTYDLSESGPAGYTGSDWVCLGGTQVDGNTITLGLGQSATCTITNDDVAPTLKLVKVVNNDNGGNAVADDWTLSAAAATPNDGRNFSNAGGSGVFETVFANTGYDLSESTVTGYTPGSWSCDGGTLVGSTIKLAEGETGVTCTITNDDSAPTLTLVKTVVNDDGGDAVVADFPLFIDGNPVTSGAPNILSANTLYTASETNLTGYTASVWGGDCNPDGTITLNEGDVKTCTITNEDIAPTLKLVKVVNNDSGGNAVADDWTLSAAAAAPFDGRNFSNPGGSGVFVTVFANQGYDLSETTLPGYTAGAWSCDGGTQVGSTLTLTEGETSVTCTITNDDSAPTLTLLKNVINDNGGNAASDDFNLTIGGNAALSGVAYTLSANTPYAINETQLSGYTFVDITGDPECPAVLGGTVTLDEGENVTCTITNDDIAPTLTLIKNVVNDHGGNAAPDDFNLTIGGSPATSGTAYTLGANTPYVINEALVSGYSFVSITGDQECPAVLGGTVTLDEGENVTCTITNDDQPATLIIIKHVINANGGTAVAADFTFDSGGVDDTPDIFPGEEAPGTTVTLDAGAYNVTETGPAGYSASFSADCSGTVANGESKTCTVINDDIQPQLIVIKHVINDNGGSADAGNFIMEVSGNSVNPDNFAGSETGVNVALDAGSYSVGETGPVGYVPSFSADCTGSIAAGETKTCTVTNNDISPTLTVVKVLLPGNDTGLFNLQIDGVTQAADVGDTGTTGAVTVDAGTHTVGETAGTGTSLSDYVTTISGDCNPDGTVSLALAENKTCTITNVRRGSIVIVKNALGGDGAFDFTSSTLGSFSLTTSGGIASTTFSGLDPANTYDVAETVPAGWELNSATCDSGETIDSIDLEPGETVTCTFENEKAGSIVIVKNTIGGEGTFDFTSNTLGNFSLTTASNTASMSFTNLDVDLTYDLAETVPAGWDLTSATCDSGETIDSIDLDPGETVTCTFTNTRRGIIIITKEAVPDDTQDFSFTATESTDTPIPDFTLDDDADATLLKTITFSDLKPGDYTVTESLVAGWDLDGMDCASTVNLNSSVNVNLNTATATVNLGPGDTVTCTFRNTKRGHIIVDKVTDPAGDPQSFSFDANGGFSPVYVDFSLTDTDAPNDQELQFGNYSVTETLPAGWDLESASCTSSIGGTETPASIELDPGETVNCTFVNEKDAFIVVEKQTDPDGDTTLFDFTTSYGPAFQLSDGQTNNSGDLDPGAYSVTETVPAGWDLESVACTSSIGDTETAGGIELDAGETVNCVFTNEKDAFIIVEKQTVPDGDPQLFDFTTSYGSAFQLGDGQTNNSSDLDPGTYSVTENVPSGWDLTSAVCSDGSAPTSISLQAGETVTCVFTNTKRGHITVDKVTLPSGDPASFSFTTTGSGYTGFSLTDAAVPNDQVLPPGTYSVTETGLTGWDLTGLSCTDPSGAPVIAGNKATISLAAGETVNCTFTNTKRGQITIVKDAVPNDAQDFAFTSTIPGAASFSLDDDSNATLPNSKSVTNLIPGAYSVTEGTVAGWDLTGLTCNDGNSTTNLGTRTASIVLDPGETVTCTFTNTKRGTIIVEKQTSPDAAPGLFTFTGTAAGSIADNGTITVANLVPGTYTSTEADPSPILFALASIVCNDGSSATPSIGNLQTSTATFNLDPGETVKCTFTNTKDFHPGTIGFWKNWRNHYTSTQFQSLINSLKTNNPKIYNKDLILSNSDDLTIAKVDAIFNVGNKTSRDQMILAQLTALKLNLAVTQLDGTSGIVQKNDDICLPGVVNVSGISGATAFFGTSTPTVQQVVTAVENRWTGNLTSNSTNWKFNFTNNTQRDMIIKVLTGINEGTIVISSGCP